MLPKPEKQGRGGNSPPLSFLAFAVLLLAVLSACVWVDASSVGTHAWESPVRLKRLWTRQLPKVARWRYKIPYLKYTVPGVSPMGELSVPLLEGGRIYVGTSSGKVLALTAEEGDELWKTRVSPDPITCKPALGEGIVAVGGQEAVVAGLDAETGEERWRRKLTAPIAGPLVYSKGRLYLQDTHGEVLAFEMATGKTLWSVAGVEPRGLIARGVGGPAINDEGTRLYVGRWDGVLMALDTAAGRVLWKQSYGGRDRRFRNTDIGLFLSENSLYFSIFMGPTFKLNLDDGIASWQATDAPASAGPASDGSRVYVPLATGGLAALDATVGAKLLGEAWGQDGLKPDLGIASQPVWLGDYLAVGTTQADHWYSRSGSIALIDPASGKLLWRSKVLRGNYSAVSASGGVTPATCSSTDWVSVP